MRRVLVVLRSADPPDLSLQPFVVRIERAGAVATPIIGMVAAVWLIARGATGSAAPAGPALAIPMIICVGLLVVGIVLQPLSPTAWSAVAAVITLGGAAVAVLLSL